MCQDAGVADVMPRDDAPAPVSIGNHKELPLDLRLV
jgi:hypothetical protein